jgi:AIPR protein
MAELQHAQIKAKITETVLPLIDVSDIENKSNDQVEAHSLSRATAVTALRIVANVELSAGAQNLVDGGSDNGIDLIYYDQQTRNLFLIQSKWSGSHSSSIASAGVLKFLSGVQDLVSLKRDRFNTKVQSRWPSIEDALRRLTSLRLVIAYPGSGRIDASIQAKIDDFVQSQNDTSELIFFQTVTQKDLFQYFVKEAAPPQIDLTIRLTHYGVIESPLPAVYGQVLASKVTDWYRRNGTQLFARNIRHFLGIKSDVNASIAKTLTDSPLNFWYFNNGLTLIVERLSKQAVGGNDRSVGLFDYQGVTIVNGAQTVGVIGQMSNATASPAMVQARIIVVQDPDSAIGKEITRASNTQNRIDARNFVALDNEQERIRTELLIDGIEYEYREGEVVESHAEGFEFIEAITTLACAGDEISYVALAKGYVGGLYADINSAPYKALFNSTTLSKRLWSLVKLVRRAEKCIRNSYNQESAVEKGIVVHGNRLLSHCVLKRIARKSDLANSDAITDEDLGQATTSTLARIREVIDEEYKDAYLAPLFKNVGKCTNIRAKVIP